MLLVGLLLTPDAVFAEPAPSEAARALAEAMGLGRTALLGMRLAMEDTAKPGEADKAVRECVKNLESTVFDEVIAIEIEAALTPDEMKAAQSFYSTSAGQKGIEAGVQELYKHAGREPPAPQSPITAAEVRETNEFAKTSAGDKLLVKQVLGTQRAVDAMRGQIGKLMSGCMEGRKPADQRRP